MIMDIHGIYVPTGTGEDSAKWRQFIAFLMRETKDGRCVIVPQGADGADAKGMTLFAMTPETFRVFPESKLSVHTTITHVA